MKKKADLFEGAAGAPAAAGNPGISINARYAGAFEERKRKQDLERAAELGLLPRGGGAGGGQAQQQQQEEEEEEEESEDEGEQLDPTLDRQITAVIQAIRARDPKVYEPGVHFFSGGEGGAAAPAAAAAAAPPAKEAKAKKRGKSAQEVVAAQLLEAAAAGREDAFEEDEELLAAHGKRAVDDGNRSANTRLYNAEQRELRDAFLASAAAEEEGGDGLLRVKPKSKLQRAAEEVEARVTREELLRAMASSKGGAAAHAQELEDPERFLTTFMQSSAWREAEREEAEDAAEAAAAAAAADEGSQDEEAASEEELDKAEQFEAKCVRARAARPAPRRPPPPFSTHLLPHPHPCSRAPPPPPTSLSPALVAGTTFALRTPRALPLSRTRAARGRRRRCAACPPSARTSARRSGSAASACAPRRRRRRAAS